MTNVYNRLRYQSVSWTSRKIEGRVLPVPWQWLMDHVEPVQDEVQTEVRDWIELVIANWEM